MSLTQINTYSINKECDNVVSVFWVNSIIGNIKSKNENTFNTNNNTELKGIMINASTNFFCAIFIV